MKVNHYSEHCASGSALATLSLTWRGGPGAGRCQTPRRPPRQTGRSRASRVQGPAEQRARGGGAPHVNSCPVKVPLQPSARLQQNCETELPHAYFVRGAFVLRDPLGVLAALRGRELGHPDLTVSSAHGQGGVPTVRQELSLRTQEKGAQQGVKKKEEVPAQIITPLFIRAATNDYLCCQLIYGLVFPNSDNSLLFST